MTEPTETNCYCVCHSEFSSRAWCEHCNGDNDVTRRYRQKKEHEATMTTPSPTASERAERLVDDYYAGSGSGLLVDRITSEITAAELAAEARGAERMRERCAEMARTDAATRCMTHAKSLKGVCGYEIAALLAALPLEEGKE